MARVCMSGNELGDYRAEGWTEFSGSPTTSVNQPGGRRTPQNNGGKYYFYLDGSIGLNQISRLINPANPCTGPAVGGYNEVYGRFAINVFNNNTNNTRTIFTLRNSNTGLNLGFIRYDGTSQSSTTWSLLNSAGSVLGTSVQQMVNNDSLFHRIEFHFKGNASSGVFELWVDDVLYLSLTSLNTSNGTTINFDTIIIGQTSATNILNGIDDIAINDLTGVVNSGRVGEGVIIAQFPSRNGTFSQLSNTYNGNVENFEHVNRILQDPSEAQFNNTLYVGTNTPGNKDSYKLPSLPSEIGGVNAVAVVANAVRNGPALTTAQALLEPGAPAPVTPITFVAAAGGLATPGTHLFFIVNKIGGAWSLPSPASADFTSVLSGNQTANLTLPLGPQTDFGIISSRDIYVTKASYDGTLASSMNGLSLPQSTINLNAIGSFGTMPATTIAAPSNGFALPQATINVASTAGFPSSGSMTVVTSAGSQTVTYNGITATAFLNCSGGTGTMSTGGAVTSLVALAYIVNAAGVTQAIQYTGVSGNALTGCTGGFGLLATNGLVYGPAYLWINVPDNSTTAESFAVADSSLTGPVMQQEMASPALQYQGASIGQPGLPNGAFGYMYALYDHNPVTGLAFSRDEIEQMEVGFQFTP